MSSETWYELLDQLVYREGLSRPQIARRSGVSTKTIASWLRGDVKRPRRWQPIARVLQALNASPEEADRILQTAGYRPAAEMITSARNEEEKELLSGWLVPSAPFMAPDLPVARMIGREYAYQNGLSALAESRRLAVWGMGGVGKTTLAIALAHELRGSYPDGVYWGNMRTSSPEAMLESWCQACGVDLGRMTDFNSRATHMRGVFSQQQALIVLDDVVDSQLASQIIPSQLSACAVIITTRSVEVAQNLTHRDEQQIVSLTPMLEDESRQLFREVLGEEVLQANRKVADKVARLLGDLPLALQIAAAMCADPGLSMKAVAKLLDNLEDRLARLQKDNKPVVRMAFDQSWERLSKNSQTALKTLGVFEGRVFDTVAFAAASGIDEVQGMFQLARLVRLSLLTAAGDDHYQQHTLLAAYSLEKLGQYRDTWRRFAAYYDGLLAGSEDRKETFQENGDNFMAAMRAAHTLADWPLVLKFYGDLRPIWKSQGLYSETREGSALATDAAKTMGDEQQQAEVQYHWGEACLEQSSYKEAVEQLHQALAYFERSENFGRIGDVYLLLSREAVERDAFEEANSVLLKGWQSYQQAEDVRGMGLALYNMGFARYNQGEFEEAVKLADDAIGSQKAAGDIRGWFESAMLATAANLQIDEIDEAEIYSREAEELVKQLDDQAETAVFDYTFAELSLSKEEFERAHEYAKKALAIFRDIRDIYSEANTLSLLAAIEVFWNEAEPDRRQVDAGLSYCREGINLNDLLDYSLGRVMFLLLNGRLLAQRGDVADACEAWRDSLELAVEIEHDPLQKRLRELLDESGCSPATPNLL